jgi:hypothetical protein
MIAANGAKRVWGGGVDFLSQAQLFDATRH